MSKKKYWPSRVNNFKKKNYHFEIFRFKYSSDELFIWEKKNIENENLESKIKKVKIG